MEDDIQKRVGGNIRRLRIAGEMTQQFLADYAVCSRRHIIALEHAEREAGILVLERIARALGVDIITLFRKDG